jgi:hypothetical protein
MRINANQACIGSPYEPTVITMKPDLIVHVFGPDALQIERTRNGHDETPQRVNLSLMELAQCFDAAHKQIKKDLEREIKGATEHIERIEDRLNAL